MAGVEQVRLVCNEWGRCWRQPDYYRSYEYYRHHDDDEWRDRYLVKDGAPLRNHVLILRDEDEAGRYWVHTRGLRKFGRPDISLRNVPESDMDRAGALCQRLVELEALGARFIDGQALEVDGIFGGLTAELGGGYDDPQFNNTYVEFNWP